MWGSLAKLAVAAVGSAAAYLATTMVTKKLSGKHLHEHAFEWWCKLRDHVTAWVARHPEVSIIQFVGKIAEAIDDKACDLKKTIDLHIIARDKNGVEHPVVTETTIPVEDLLMKYPDFKTQTVCSLEDLV